MKQTNIDKRIQEELSDVICTYFEQNGLCGLVDLVSVDGDTLNLSVEIETQEYDGIDPDCKDCFNKHDDPDCNTCCADNDILASAY